MTLKLQVVDPEVDLPAIAQCLFESYEDLPQPSFHVFFPTHGTGEAARGAAIEEAAARLKLWNAHGKTMYWQKVTCFPDDGSRRFVEKALQNHTRSRSQAAPRPHLYLFIIFTHPDYRLQGVGQQFMNWGMKKADELGFDFYLDSTPYGRPLYEANGFR
ncbi:hypothetical protein PG990_008107 [Apiospora arundinis]